MSPPSTPSGGDWSTPNYSGARPDGSRYGSGTDEGWGPSTSVRRNPTGTRVQPPARGEPRRGGDQWSPAGPASGRDQRAVRTAEREQQQRRRTAERDRAATAAALEKPRGLPWWGALLILLAIAVIGGAIDSASSSQGAFNVAIIVASVIAVLAVRRTQLFPVVVAPPIVYSVASIFMLYIRSDGLHDKREVIDALSNYLVYGFPAIASATAAVLIIAGIRMIIRK